MILDSKEKMENLQQKITDFYTYDNFSVNDPKSVSGGKRIDIEEHSTEDNKEVKLKFLTIYFYTKENKVMIQGSDINTLYVCSVHQGDTMSTSGGYHEYIGGCSVHRGDTVSTFGDIMSTFGDIMSTLGMFSEINNKISNMFGDVFSGIEVIPLQQQPNGCDCGVFSIAFATCLVFQLKPESVQFINNEMRPHLAQCLRSSQMELFPVISVYC